MARQKKLKVVKPSAVDTTTQTTIQSTPDVTTSVATTSSVGNTTSVAAPAPLVVLPSAPTVTTSVSKTVLPSFSKSLLKSRKFIYGTLAMGLATSMYAWNVFLVTKYPYAQASYLSLFQMMISFIAGLTSAVLGLHSWMEFSTAATNTISNSSAVSSAITAAKNFNYNFSDDQKSENVTASRKNTE
jgi:hypothetical protein